jgi:hypothetical protein
MKKETTAARMSYEEFLALCDEDTLAEWVDGEVAMYSPTSRRHPILEALRELGGHPLKWPGYGFRVVPRC